MTNDEKINMILESIKNHGTIPLYDWIAQKLNEHDHASENNHRTMINKMIDNGLIKRARDGREWYEVTTKGIDITEKGGWLKYLINQMTEEQKVHRLLEFMAKTGEYHWSPETLMPAFDNLLNEHEIEYLCLILIDNGDVNDNRTKDGFAIGFSDRSKSVFHGNKYLKARPSNEIKVEVGQIQNIQDSIINAPVSQSRDDLSFNKTYSKVTNAPTPAETKQKPKIWTASNIMFVILTGIIVGLLVLIFWEKIRVFFE